MEKKIEELELRVKHLQETLGSLIAWMAQSANSPISVSDAQFLLRGLTPPEK